MVRIRRIRSWIQQRSTLHLLHIAVMTTTNQNSTLQENSDTLKPPGSESCQAITLILNMPLPDLADWEHIVVYLSLWKQEQIMEGIGRVHSEESHFSTWIVVGEGLSNALLSEPDGLYVQSATKIHRKDFLLYTRKRDARADGTRGNLEIDFTQRLETTKWQCHWRKARPQFVHVVKTCELLQNMNLSRMLNMTQRSSSSSNSKK